MLHMLLREFVRSNRFGYDFLCRTNGAAEVAENRQRLGDGSTTVRIQRGCRFRPYIQFIGTTSRLELDTSLTAAGVGGGSQGSLWILWRCIVEIPPQGTRTGGPGTRFTVVQSRSGTWECAPTRRGFNLVTRLVVR
jgi:hypothetical protein